MVNGLPVASPLADFSLVVAGMCGPVVGTWSFALINLGAPTDPYVVWNGTSWAVTEGTAGVAAVTAMNCTP